MEMCHLFFFLPFFLLCNCGPALRDKGSLHAVGVDNPSENFPSSVWVSWLTLKLRFNVATSLASWCSPCKRSLDSFDVFVKKVAGSSAAILDSGEGLLAPLEDVVIEQLVEAVPIKIGILALAPYGLRPGDEAPSGHAELVLYELPEVVDHVATQAPTVQVVEQPIGMVQRRSRRTSHAHPSLAEIGGLPLAKADGTESVWYIRLEYLDVAEVPVSGR